MKSKENRKKRSMGEEEGVVVEGNKEEEEGREGVGRGKPLVEKISLDLI